MPISFLLLTEFSFFGFHREFLLSILIAFILMDLFTCLKHLIQHHDLRYGFLAFKISKEVSEILCLFLLFALGFKSLYSPSSRGFVQFLFDLRRNLGKYLCSEKNIVENCVRLEDLAEEITEKSNNYPSRELDGECMDECDGGYEDESRRGEGYDSELRKLVKIERSRANAAVAELVKERASSATAAEEAMAMIMRLQNEKSSIEMESSQYRRLAEEKQMHDHQVIQSLQLFVWRKEMMVQLLQQELNRSDESGFRLEEEQSENVFCSSLDFNLSLK